jgi:hypothetical protein
MSNCPDCGADPDVLHYETCPMLRGIRAAEADDAFWFRRFPWMAGRIRQPFVAERNEYLWQYNLVLTDQIAVFRNGQYALLVADVS